MPVEEVNEVGSELNAEFLVNVEVLLQRQVFADDSDVAGLRVRVGAASEGERGGIREERLVQVGIARRPQVGEIERAFVETGRPRVPGRYVGAVHSAIP